MRKARIDEKMAAEIKGMLARGQPQMEIALWYGINQARVSEIRLGKRGAGKRFRHVPPADVSHIPLGPYIVTSVRDLTATQRALVARDTIIRELEVLLGRYRQFADARV